jgi:hypothetical protein
MLAEIQAQMRNGSCGDPADVTHEVIPRVLSASGRRSPHFVASVGQYGDYRGCRGQSLHLQMRIEQRESLPLVWWAWTDRMRESDQKLSLKVCQNCLWA